MRSADCRPFDICKTKNDDSDKKYNKIEDRFDNSNKNYKNNNDNNHSSSLRCLLFRECYATFTDTCTNQNSPEVIQLPGRKPYTGPPVFDVHALTT